MAPRPIHITLGDPDRKALQATILAFLAEEVWRCYMDGIDLTIDGHKLRGLGYWWLYKLLRNESLLIRRGLPEIVRGGPYDPPVFIWSAER